MDSEIISFLTFLTLGFFSGQGIACFVLWIISRVVGFVVQKYVFGRHPVTKNSAVIITGASSGIGKHVALSLARKGVTVFATVRKQDDGDKLKKESPSIIPIIADVTNETQIDNAAKEINKTLQSKKLQLIALVNNAGYAESSILEFIPLDRLRQQFEVNVFGQVAFTQKIIPLMRNQKLQQTPRIIFISSGFGKLSSTVLGSYCSTKHAIESLADVFRMELKSWNIDVAVIEPGAIKTNFLQTTTQTGEDNQKLFNSMKEKNPDSKDVIERYEIMTKNMQEKQIILKKYTSPPQETTNAIEAAIFDKCPKTRYSAGADVSYGLSLVLALPDRVKDLLFGRFFKKA